jgi:omega-6 fatty acid desaturase (delta-12 desaturase)
MLDKSWKQTVAKYRKPDARSWWQVANSFAPYAALWVLMYLSLDVSYLLTLALAVPAAGFLMRIFIILHDCGHGAFLKSKTARDRLGFICGVLTFTPYFHWRHTHAVHHATSGDLDNRGTGDIWMLTVDEYAALPRLKRWRYRFYRNPLVLFGIGPLVLFFILHRVPTGAGADKKRERNNVYWTNLALLGVLALAAVTIGLKAYILIQLPIAVIAFSFGVWLFYIQHQFETCYWERHENWDYLTAATMGSSYYKLPKVLQWFTGNIGFHHIHHLSPMVPNYNLERCYNENPVFRQSPTLTLRTSLQSLRLYLWDEEQKRLVGFKQAASQKGTT